MEVNQRLISRRRERRAIAGVLIGMMMFALLFTAGTAYFLLINSANGLNNQAANSAQAAIGQVAGERLVMSLSVCGATGTWCNANLGSLGIRAFNSGGVAATIVAVFAKNSLGQNAIIPPAPQYLTVGPNLNFSLPLALSVGASTSSMTGCGIAASCSIGIPLTAFNPSAYTLAAPATISILTKAGNVFSTQYPPAPLTSTTTISTSNTVSNTITTTTGGPGGNTLVIQMVATPNQVFSGAIVTLTINVYNYALLAVTSVTLSPAPPTPTVSGTASLTGGSCAPASYASIAAYSGSGNAPYVTFTCTYTAHTGAVGGFATFSGSALAVLSGNSISSNQAMSNTVQIGGTTNVTTEGAFSINFFFFRYSACFQAGGTNYVGPCTPTPSPMPPANLYNLPYGATLSAGRNHYVAFYVQVTNNFNATLPILDYSLLQLDQSLGGETDFFLVGVATNPQVTYFPNYAANPPTLTAYTGTEITCAETPPLYNPPPPTTCIDVAPGQTVTLTFAACGFGATNWDWGGIQYGADWDNSAGCVTSKPSIGYGLGIASAAAVITTLVYIYKGQVYTQDIAFQGEALLP